MSSCIDGLSKLLERAQQIQKCHKKYRISVDVLNATFTQVQLAVDAVTHAAPLHVLTAQIASLIEAQDNIHRRQPCVATMHEQVAEIEALTFSVTNIDVETVNRR